MLTEQQLEGAGRLAGQLARVLPAMLPATSGQLVRQLRCQVFIVETALAAAVQEGLVHPELDRFGRWTAVAR